MKSAGTEHSVRVEAQYLPGLSTGRSRIRKAAEKDKNVRFTALFHHITEELLKESYYSLNPKASPGVDGETWEDYGVNLKERVADLHRRLNRGAYRAKPARRTYIPKAGDEMRPLGIAAFEDKVVQMAVVKVLGQIYEVDFLNFSHGFRPGRSPHNALDALAVGLKQRRINWILDMDMRRFFDTMCHEWVLKFMEHRIADPRILRLIRKWLRAGVSEDGEWSETKVGTPQGAVISPLLANIYLHYVFDLWVNHWRKRKARGDVTVVRYADDVVMGFQYEEDARTFMSELLERLRRFGLELNQRKTRLIEFGRYAAERRRKRGKGKPETFDFLGFTHICSRSRKNGRFILKRKTVAKRLSRKIKEIRRELYWNRHKSITEHGSWLKMVLRGYYNYHGVPGNIRALSRLRRETARAWLWALRRRSQKGRCTTWDDINKLADKWLPLPKITHPYPDKRLIVRT